MRPDTIILRPDSGRWRAGVGMGLGHHVAGTTNAGYLDLLGSWETELDAERAAIHGWQIEHGRDALPAVVVVHRAAKGVEADSRPLTAGVMDRPPALGMNNRERAALARWRSGETPRAVHHLRDIAERCREDGWYLPDLGALERWLATQEEGR